MANKGKIYIDRDTLVNCYVEQGEALGDIGNIYGVTYKPIIRHLRHYQIPLRTQAESCRTERARGKNRDAHMGKRHSEETHEKMRNRPRYYGWHLKEETKEKLRQSQLGNTHMRDAIASGFVHTDEMRMKMRNANIGRQASIETRAKLSKASLGHRRHTPFQIQLLREKMIGNKLTQGRKQTDVERQLHSLALIGERNHQWCGGIGREPYAYDFNEALKESIRMRDDYKCQLCGVPQIECIRRLGIHHIDYNKKNSSPSNLTCLCIKCNNRVNNHRAYWQGYFLSRITVKPVEGKQQ